MSDVDIQENVSNPHVPGETPTAAETMADSATATTDENPADTQEPADEKAKASAGLQKAINRLTRQRGDAERRAMRLEAELEAHRRIAAPQQQQPKSVSELKESDFATYGEFVRAQAKGAAREEIEAERWEQSQWQASVAAKTLHQTFVKEAAEQAKAAGIDFEDAWETLLALPKEDVSTTVAAYFFEAAENKAAMADHFAKNTDELARISHLSSPLAFRDLAKLDARLGAAPKPRTTQAPAPVPMVRAGGAPVNDPMRLSTADYIEHRRKQMTTGR